MTRSAGLVRVALGLLLIFSLGGCMPAASQLDEEREPHFLAGKSRISTMDFQGAIEAFEQALQVNPQSASAHFELACLCDQKESDPAAAIYHYDCYLKLRPGAENAGVVKERIMKCKQQLAQTVSLGPVSEKVQHDLQELTQENQRLTEQNRVLKAQLDSWQAYAARLDALTNQPPAAIPSRAPSLVAAPIPTNLAEAPTAPTTHRTHTVKPGETPILIAKRYGIRLNALLAANPGLDPRRLRVGQNLNVPGR